MFHAEAPAIASRSLAIAPSKPQREGIRYISGLRFGFVVIGTIRPPRTTCGMSAIGVSAIAASADATSVETQEPERRRVHRERDDDCASSMQERRPARR